MEIVYILQFVTTICVHRTINKHLRTLRFRSYHNTSKYGHCHRCTIESHASPRSSNALPLYLRCGTLQHIDCTHTERSKN